MRRARLFFRVAGMALILASLAAPCATGVIAAEPAPPDKKDAAPAKTFPLSPALEAKLKEFVDKARVEVDKAWDARMRQEIENIAKTTGLKDEGKKALEPAAKQAIDASLDEWSDQVGDVFRKQFFQQQAQAMRMLDQMLAQIPQIAAASSMQAGIGGDVTQPFDQDVWIKAVHQTLDPTQAAAWDKVMSDRKDEKEKQIGGVLKNGAGRIRDQQTEEILSQCKEIELALALPQDRADKLEALGKSVVDQTVKMWRKRVEAMLLGMPEDQLRQFTANGNVFFGANPNESPGEQTAWKEGVASLLTPGEVARLQTAADARKAKRAHVMGEVMIMLLDEKIAFTAVQRQKLQPIADRLVKDVPELYPDGASNINFNVPSGVFFTAAARATDAELKPILDEIQRKHWRHLAEPENGAVDVTDDGKAKSDENGEPEDLEKIISNFLYKKTEEERKSSLATTVLTVEDAVRVAGLGAETAARLQLAARGTAETSLASWKWFTEQQIRAQLQGATLQDVKQRLQGMQGMQAMQMQRVFAIQGINGNIQKHQTILEKTLQTDLTAAQQEAWKKETDAREAFRDQAIASLIMAEFDRKNQLTPDQWEKLEPVIAGLVRDYGQDIPRMFGGMNPVPWYMMGGGWGFTPFAGIPEADFKAILTKDQWTRWSASQECANAANIWQNVQQIHNQRIKASK